MVTASKQFEREVESVELRACRGCRERDAEAQR